jgi:DNA-directed RNA polymerase specialized sigma24 family protein
LEGLSAQNRQLMQRRYDGSLGGIAELAGQLERSVQSVYARIKRIKMRLRACVERRLAMERSA